MSPVRRVYSESIARQRTGGVSFAYVRARVWGRIDTVVTLSSYLHFWRSTTRITTSTKQRTWVYGE